MSWCAPLGADMPCTCTDRVAGLNTGMRLQDVFAAQLDGAVPLITFLQAAAAAGPESDGMVCP